MQHANTQNLVWLEEEVVHVCEDVCVFMCVPVCAHRDLRGGSLWILTFKADSRELEGFQSVNHPLLAGCLGEDGGKERKKNNKRAGAWQKGEVAFLSPPTSMSNSQVGGRMYIFLYFTS